MRNCDGCQSNPMTFIGSALDINIYHCKACGHETLVAEPEPSNGTPFASGLTAVETLRVLAAADCPLR